MVDFWTFLCYNCLNALPRVEAFEAKYRDRRSIPREFGADGLAPLSKVSKDNERDARDGEDCFCCEREAIGNARELGPVR